jgi:CRISPR-associated protein Cas1
MDTKLWPARNVGEYAYCPRLFYFMEVEGIHVPSSDTEEGQRIHRRVDEPSAAVPESEHEGGSTKPRKARSFTLTSERLGLTATLDLAEIDGSVAVPVEYRKGRPRQVYDEDGEGHRLRELADRACADRPAGDPAGRGRI